MQKWKKAVITLAMAGLFLATEGLAIDVSQVSYSQSSSTGTTLGISATINTNLYLVDVKCSGARVITCTTPTGGLLFFDASTAALAQSIGVITNTLLQSQFQSLKNGAVPICGTADGGFAYGLNTVRLTPNSPLGLIKTPVFFVSTNVATNITTGISVLRLFNP